MREEAREEKLPCSPEISLLKRHQELQGRATTVSCLQAAVSSFDRAPRGSVAAHSATAQHRPDVEEVERGNWTQYLFQTSDVNI